MADHSPPTVCICCCRNACRMSHVKYSLLQIVIGISIINLQAMANAKVRNRTDFILSSRSGASYHSERRGEITRLEFETIVICCYAYVMGSLIAVAGVNQLVAAWSTRNGCSLNEFSSPTQSDASTSAVASIACIVGPVTFYLYIDRWEHTDYGSGLANVISAITFAIGRQIGWCYSAIKTELLVAALLGIANLFVVNKKLRLTCWNNAG